MKLVVTLSVCEFADIYIERYAKPKKKSWFEDQRRNNLYIKPFFANQNLDGVTNLTITNLILQIGRDQNKPYAANRVQEQLRKMFNLAIRWGFLPRDFENPAREIEPFNEVARDRFLTSEEQARIIASIDQERNEYVRAAFKLLMLTSLRRNEILNLRWTDVDLDAATITIRTSKNGNTLFQPLNKQAIAVLSDLPRLGPYVIVGGEGRGHRYITDKPRNTITKAWSRIRQRANVAGVCIHDLRRTGGSILAQAGVPIPVVGKVLNQLSTDSTMVYARFTDKAKRDALDFLGDHFEQVSEAIAKV